MHVHVTSPSGEAKFWLEPTVALAHYSVLSRKELRKLQSLVEERQNAIEKAWEEHFGR